MGCGDPRNTRSGRMVGRRGGPLPAQISLDQLDAPHLVRSRADQRRSSDREGVRPVDEPVHQSRRRLRHGRLEEWPPLHDREHGAGPRAIRLRRSSRRGGCLRMARQEPRQEGRMELLRERSEPGLLGRDECLRGVSAGEMDGGHEERRGAWGRIFPRARIASPGGGDSRLQHAVSHLEKKRRSDGRWNLDAIHPDVGGSMSEWYVKHPKQMLTPFALESVGAPSKMITLTAMTVLERLKAAQ